VRGALASALLLGSLAACGPGAPDGGAAPAPDDFRITFETSEGPFTVEFIRAWSPLAVDRVWELGQAGFWEGARIYRVNDRYAQFGYSGRPELDARWIPAGVPDEPAQASNERGTVSFARGGPHTRSAILFVNRSDNSNLDDLEWYGVLGFPPVGRVVSGMDVIDSLHDGYGDAPMEWEDSIAALGNPFLDRMYPDLDSITSLQVAASQR
jgi:cyclophilin family peptidyl-prolyl cis-trans isomerase